MLQHKPLEYGLDALEPHIDKATMECHHGKHYKAYVDNANKAKEGILHAKTAQEIYLFTKMLEDNTGGVVNHELYFCCLAPKSNGGGKLPTNGPFYEAVVARYQSFDRLIERLKAEGMGRFGSGWVFLSKDLSIVTTPNQESLRVPGAILGIDVWEHAYYLKHQNRRADYLNNIFEVINWTYVESLFSSHQ